MSDEKMAILRMLEEGKISAAEAAKLLAAVGHERDEGAQSESSSAAGGNEESGSGEEGGEKSSTSTEGDLFENLGNNLGRVFKAVQSMDVDRVVRAAKETANETVSTVRDTAGKRINDVMDDVSDIVFDVTGRGEKEEVVEEEQWNLPAAGVARIQVETGNGPITVTAAETDQVEVVAQTRVIARDLTTARSFIDQVEVGVEEADGEIRLYREHPRPPAGVSVVVSFDLRCPADLHTRAYTLNGKIEIQGLRGDIDAASSNGVVSVEGGVGSVNARTKNGKVRAIVEELRGKGEFESINGQIEVEIRAGQAGLHAKTLNGSVDVKVPVGFDGQLEAHTTNGRVTCAFPIPVSEPVRKTRISGPLGRGGEDLIKLQTLNGSISLKPTTE